MYKKYFSLQYQCIPLLVETAEQIDAATTTATTTATITATTTATITATTTATITATITAHIAAPTSHKLHCHS